MEYTIYITLHLLFLFIFIRCGKDIHTNIEGHYIQYIFLCILTFTLMQGSRYLTGNDYLHYIDVYNYNLESEQKAFTFLNDILKNYGVGEYHFYYIYAFIYIVCAMFLLMEYKEYIQFSLPLFLVCTLMFHEYMIRQALGTSFIFIFLTLINKTIITTQYNINSILSVKKICYIFASIIFATLSYSIHSANLITIGFITIGVIFYRRSIPLYISIPGVILANYVLQYTFDYSLLEGPLSYLSTTDDKIASYAGSADRWFSEEGYNNQYTRNPFVQIFEIIGCISLFYFGKKALDKHMPTPLSYTLYNLFVLGYIFQGMFRQLELLGRMSFAISRFWFIPLAIVLYHKKDIIETKFEKTLFYGLFFWGYEYAKFLFMKNPERILFLWDM